MHGCDYFHSFHGITGELTYPKRQFNHSSVIGEARNPRVSVGYRRADALQHFIFGYDSYKLNLYLASASTSTKAVIGS